MSPPSSCNGPLPLTNLSHTLFPTYNLLLLQTHAKYFKVFYWFLPLRPKWVSLAFNNNKKRRNPEYTPTLCPLVPSVLFVFWMSLAHLPYHNPLTGRIPLCQLHGPLPRGWRLCQKLGRAANHFNGFWQKSLVRNAEEHGLGAEDSRLQPW